MASYPATSVGMYGLNFIGLPGDRDVTLAATVDDAVPMLVRVELGPQAAEFPAPGENGFDAERAVLGLPEGRLAVTRSPLISQFTLHHPVAPAALIHPYLAFPAAVASNWLGRVALHAGAVGHGEATVAVVGGKEGGKSSTMAACAGAGFEVITDDLLIVEKGSVFPGPRCIDLREGSRFLGRAIPQGRLGSRERWRIPLAPLKTTRRLVGFVRLAWDEGVSLVEIPASERVPALLGAAALGYGILPAGAPLELCRLPWWELKRPKDITSLPDVVDRLSRLLLSV